MTMSQGSQWVMFAFGDCQLFSLPGMYAVHRSTCTTTPRRYSPSKLCLLARFLGCLLPA
jgi:hypothetical protein